MEYIVGIALIALIVWLVRGPLSAKNDPVPDIPKKMAPRPQAQRAPRPRRENKKWVEVEIPAHSPEGKWVRSDYGTFKVAGTTRRVKGFTALASHLQNSMDTQDQLLIDLEREPDNPVDEHAIKVFARYGRKGKKRVQLGYAEANFAEWLADEFDPDMPIAANMVEFRVLPDEAASITLMGYVPPSKARAKYLL